jgi:CRISPR/Cas system-associated exonuclease Cas4 (RecB family)
LEEVVTEVAAEHKERLAPAIERVWDDGIRTIKADLREWLERECAEVGWLPQNFEFSFGPSQVPHADPNSRAEAVQLDCRIQLRGSIDLVERSVSGALRATDYKTGKVSVDADALIKHGEVLQPVLYALALEKLFPGEQVVGGRLYFCTSKGEFSAALVPLDEEARAAAMTVASAIGDALDRGFLPAAPKKEGCKYCEYLPVCGPNEEHRVKRKPQSELELLDIVRSSR